MGWAIGYDYNLRRDVGYGVPAICDDPECSTEIDRGLSHVCGGEPFGGDCGCGLHFCGKHLWYGEDAQVCRQCLDGKPAFEPKPDTREWLEWKLTDQSWAEWRDSDPEEVARIKATLAEPSALPCHAGEVERG